MCTKLRDKLDKKNFVIISSILCTLLTIAVCTPILVLYGNFQNSKISISDSDDKVTMAMKVKRPKLRKPMKIITKKWYRPTETKSTTLSTSSIISVSMNTTSTLVVNNTTTEYSSTTFDITNTTYNPTTLSSTTITTKEKKCDCKNDYKPVVLDNKKQCLKYVGPAKISSAMSLCQSHSGVLPLPKNQNENSDFISFFKSLTNLLTTGVPVDQRYRVLQSWGNLPVDLSDVELEGTFITSKGQKPTFTNWNTGEPNNNHAGGEDYVTVQPHAQGLWNDYNGDVWAAVICQQQC